MVNLSFGSQALLTDDDIFGAPAAPEQARPTLLTDADIFGAPEPAPAQPAAVAAPEPAQPEAAPAITRPEPGWMDERLGAGPATLPPLAARAPRGVLGEDDLLTRRGQQFATGAISTFSDAIRGAAAMQADMEANVSPEGIERRKVQGPAADRAYAERLSQTLKEAGLEAKPRDAQDVPLYGQANRLDQWAKDTVGVPADDPSFWGQFATGAGSFAAFMATAIPASALGPAGTAAAGGALGAGVTSGQAYREAIEAGASEDKARDAAAVARVIGSTEVVPILDILKPLDRAFPQLKGKIIAIAGKALRDAGEEGLQEGLSQIAQNLNAAAFYDPQRGWSDGVTESAIIGAALGGVAGGASGAVQRPREAREQAPAQPVKATPVQDAAEDAVLAQREAALDRQIEAAPTPEAAAPLKAEIEAVQERRGDVQSPIPTPLIDQGRAIMDAALKGEPIPGSPETLPPPPPPPPPVEVDIDEAAILLGAKWSPEDIRDMSPEERKAEVEHAREQEARPLPKSIAAKRMGEAGAEAGAQAAPITTTTTPSIEGVQLSPEVSAQPTQAVAPTAVPEQAAAPIPEVAQAAPPAPTAATAQPSPEPAVAEPTLSDSEVGFDDLVPDAKPDRASEAEMDAINRRVTEVGFNGKGATDRDKVGWQIATGMIAERGGTVVHLRNGAWHPLTAEQNKFLSDNKLTVPPAAAAATPAAEAPPAATPVAPAPEAAVRPAQRVSEGTDPRRGRATVERETASWIIRNKETGEVQMETGQKSVVDKVNTAKYEAVPVAQHLSEISRPGTKAHAWATRGKPVSVQKKPFTHRMKAVGIDPTGKVAAELRSAGITPQNTPGLFRKGGAKDVDNLPAAEWSDLAPEVGTDGQYLSRQGVIDALVREHRGEAVRNREQNEAAAVQAAKDEQARALDEATGWIEGKRADGLKLTDDEAKMLARRIAESGDDPQDVVWEWLGEDASDIESDYAEPARSDIPGFESERPAEAGRRGADRSEGERPAEGRGAAAGAQRSRDAGQEAAPVIRALARRREEYEDLVSRWGADPSAREAMLAAANLPKTWAGSPFRSLPLDVENRILAANLPKTSISEEIAALTERTPEGIQRVIPGAERISDRALAERKQQQPKRGGNASMQDDGLFGDPENRGDLFDAPKRGPRFSRANSDMTFADSEEEPKSITVYHGSPHDFDRFSMDKIGTGEGAQVYGHGLYFADKEDVAKSYKESLATGIKVDGKPLHVNNRKVGSTGDSEIDDLLVSMNGDVEAAIDYAKRAAIEDAGTPSAKYHDALVPKLEALRGRVTTDDLGHMYEVSINADPEDFLDWDKPLSEQSEKVRGFAAARGITEEPPIKWTANEVGGSYSRVKPDGTITKIGRVTDTGFGWRAEFGKTDLGTHSSMESARAALDRHIAASGQPLETRGRLTGANLYGSVGGRPDSMVHTDTAGASKAFLDAGIPGIRYLDQGSRTAGEGSRNYVVFDDSLVTIKRKYNRTTQIAGTTVEFSEALPSIFADLQKRLARIAPGVTLQMPDRITDPTKGTAFSGSNGMQFGSMVYVALNSNESKRWVLHHEVVHALRNPDLWDKPYGLFTRLEWETLERAARRDTKRRSEVARFYADFDEEAQIEEVIANTFADWQDGQETAHKRIFGKIAAFFRALKSVLSGHGFTDPKAVFTRQQEIVFAKMARGEVGRRGGEDRVQGFMREDALATDTARSRFLRLAQAITETPAFKRWFGKSKVVDAEGEPLVVYHGTDADFEFFSTNLPPKWMGGTKPRGFFFSADPRYGYISTSEREGQQVIPVYLKIEKPYFVSHSGQMEGLNVWDDAPEWLESLKAQGYDGIIWGDPKDLTRPPRGAWGNDRSQIFVFEPTQVKSIWNTGAFSPSDPRIRFSRREAFSEASRQKIAAANAAAGAQPRAQQQALPAAFPTPKRGAWFRAIEAIDDRFHMLQRAQESIEKVRGAPLPESINAYLATSLYDTKTAARLQKWRADELDDITGEMRRQKVSMDEIGEYLIARHAPERNAVMAQRDPQRFGNGGGSGMLDAAAASIIADFRARGKIAALDAVAAKVDAMIKADLQRRYLAGLISQDQHREWSTMYQHYVPLRGSAERDDDGGQVGRIGKGFDIRGKESQSALGRESLSDHPLVQAALMAQEGIVRVAKNNVAKTLARLVESEPNPDLWETLGKLPTRRVLNAQGQVVEMPDVQGLRDDSVLAYKVGGKVRYILLNDPVLAFAAKNLGSQAVPQFGASGEKILRMLRVPTRAFARLNTGANPDFVLPNLQADMMEAALTAYGHKQKGMTRSFSKHFMPAFYTVAAREFGGTRVAPPRYSALYDEWLEAGGKMDYMAFRDLDEITDEIKGQIVAGKRFRVPLNPLKLADNTLKAVEHLNQPFESASRFAMYVAARERGMSKAEAAAMSLDASGNYTRKGTWTPAMSAAYAFFNPSVKGIEKVGRLVGVRQGNLSLRGKMALAYMGTVAAGYAMAQMVASAFPDDDDPEKRALLWRVPSWERARAIIIPWGTTEETVTGPQGSETVQRLGYTPYRIAHSLRPFWVLGQALYGLQSGALTPKEALAEIGAAVAANANPLGSEQIANALMPTVADPFVDLSLNRGWTGTPIHPEEAPWNAGVPPSRQYFPRSTTDAAVFAAQGIAEITGGTPFTPGAVDLYPNTLDYLFEYATGGFGRFITRTIQTGADAVAGVETPPNRIPIGRMFYGRTDKQAEATRFYDALNAVNARANALTQAKKAFEAGGSDVTWEDIQVQAHDLGAEVRQGKDTNWKKSTWKILDKANDVTKALRAEITALQQADGPRSEREAQIKEIEGQIEGVQRQARRDYLRRQMEIGGL